MYNKAIRFMGTTPAENDILHPLLEGIERYGRERIDAKRIDADHHIPKEILRELASLGMFGLSLPEEYGGAGLSLAGVCSSIAALARFDRSVATTVGLHLGLGTRPLVAFGTEDLKARYLPALASGEKIAAFATTEAGAGSDLSAIRTTAVAEGSDLIVNGSKVYVTNGGLADVVTITASTPGLGGAKRGHSLVLLERGDGGLEVGPEEHKLGLRGSSTTPLYFEDVRVPSSRLIGEPSKAMSHLEHVLAWGRTVMAAGCAGAARSALFQAARHVTTRVQFGRPLSEFEVVQAQLAWMASTLFAMESLISAVCVAEREPFLLLRRSISAKIFASDRDWSIVDTALQLHGGSGFIEDTEMPLLLRDARVTRIFEGANDVLLVHAGSMEIGAPDHRVNLGEQKVVESAASPSVSRVGTDGEKLGEELSQLAREADAVHRLLRRKVEELKQAYGLKLLKNQREIHRVGRLCVLRDACDASVERASSDRSEKSLRLAQSFIGSAALEARSLFEPLLPKESVDPIARFVCAEVVS